jgi:hypothetical protein
VTIFVTGSLEDHDLPWHDTRFEVVAKPKVLTFTAANWQTPQTVTISAMDDKLDELTELHVMSHIVLSDDASYNSSGVANRENDETLGNAKAGVTFQRGVFSSNPRHIGSWPSSQGIPTSPSTNEVNVAIHDNDHAGILFVSDQKRFNGGKCVQCERCHTCWFGTCAGRTDIACDDCNRCIADGCNSVYCTGVSSYAKTASNPEGKKMVTSGSWPRELDYAPIGSTTSVSVREYGSNDTYGVKLMSQPFAAVTVMVHNSAPSELGVTPTSLTFTPSRFANGSGWKHTQYVTVYAIADDEAESLEAYTLSHSSNSADPLYNTANGTVPMFPGSINVGVYDNVGVVLSKTIVEPRENGQHDVYSVTLSSAPMHSEMVNYTSPPYRFNIECSKDTYVENLQANSSHGYAPELKIAKNGSTGLQTSYLTFPIGDKGDDGLNLEMAAGASVVGAAFLRLYRIKGGENNGVGGISVSVAPVNDSSWKEEDLSHLCLHNEQQCEISSYQQTQINGTNRTVAIRTGKTFTPLTIIPISGMSAYQSWTTTPVPVRTVFNRTSNVYEDLETDWIDLDVTGPINEALRLKMSKISLKVFVTARADRLAVNYSDQVVFASRENPSVLRRPHLLINPSGTVNLAHGKPSQQSTAGGAENKAVDGIVHVSDESSYAMTPVVAKTPWWQTDLLNTAAIESVILYVRALATESSNRASPTVQAYIMLADTPYVKSDGNPITDINEALAHSKLKTLRTITRKPAAQLSSSHSLIEVKWNIGDQVSGIWDAGIYEDRRLLFPKARYLRVQGKGFSYMQLAEVKIFKPASASTKIAVGAYLRKPSLLRNDSAVKVSPSDSCNTLNQCRSELVFTPGNFDQAQNVTVDALNDDVAAGQLSVAITHRSRSTDIDYNRAGVCDNPRKCHLGALFRPQSTVQALLRDEDEAGISLSVNTVNVTEGAHFYPNAKVFQKLENITTFTISCSEPRRTLSEADKKMGIKDDWCTAAFDGDITSVAKMSKSTTMMLSGRGQSQVQLTFDQVKKINVIKIYKPALAPLSNLKASRGVKRITLYHYVSGSGWEPVPNGSFNIPWGSVEHAAWHTFSGFSTNSQYLQIRINDVYGTEGADLFEVVFTRVHRYSNP